MIVKRKLILLLLAQCICAYCLYAQTPLNFQELLGKANTGDSDAQFMVAQCYEFGEGVAQNYSDAFGWYTKAAEQGNVDAMVSIGFFHARGMYVPQNPVEAFKWWKKAAELGSGEAQYYVGMHYYKGLYIMGKDYSEAVKWYSLAMQQNWPFAFNDMALMYMNGEGVERNEKKAFEMIDEAIKLSPNYYGFYDTKGELYSIIGDKEHALEMWDIITRLNPTYDEGDTNFSRYIKNLMYVDVDVNIPVYASKNDNAFAIIIANEHYSKEIEVPYALNDGNVFSNYCSSVLGVPSTNIHLVKNATLNDIRHEVDWITNVMDAYNGKAKVIFYYAGHGIPDETTKTAFLLPVDAYGTDVSSGYSLDDLYMALGKFPSESVTVFLDACFSGTKRDGEMADSARGIAIKVNATNPIGNVVVFSASQGDETAYPYTEKRHGLFTYYLLKKLQETGGSVTLGELSDYVTTQVKRQSIVVNGKSQTPSVISSSKMSDSWRIESIR